MTESKHPLFLEALFFYAKFEERFLEFSALLRELKAQSPADFKALIALPQLGRRKGYYLVSVSKAFGDYPHLRPRLMKVGWTRLSLAAPHVTKENVEDALLFCELNTAWAIAERLKGSALPLGVRSVLLHFSPEDFATCGEAIVQHGATKTADGFVDKEKALITALTKAAACGAADRG
jgi:hypothetical protein